MRSHSSTGSAGSVLRLEDRSGRRGAFKKGDTECRDYIGIVDPVFTWRQTVILGRIIVVCVPISRTGMHSTLNANPASLQFCGLAELREPDGISSLCSP